MKNIIIKICTIYFLLLLVFNIKSYAVELKDALSAKSEMVVGDTQTITLKDKSANSIYDLSKAKVTSWTSSDNKIVSISSEQTTGNMYISNPMSKGYEHKATLTAKKSGKVTITVTYDVSANTSFITYVSKIDITVKSKQEAAGEIQEEIKELDLKDKYKTVPDKTADAQTIKYFIISDQNYNNPKSKALKNVAKTDMQKIKSWKETIDKKIASDRNHYGQPKQYGAIRDVLNDIISANNEGKSTDDAIDNNSDAIQESYNLTNESNGRVITALKMKIESLIGETRDNYQFNDVLTDTEFYTGINDIDSSDAARVEKTVSKVLSVITNIGIILSVIIPAIVGVKYMIGSVDEKAEYKKDMVPYLVGAFMLFAISTLVKILQSFGNQINTI